MALNGLYEINKTVNELLDVLREERNHMPPQEVEEKLRKLERKRYREEFTQSMCCNLKTCRYNQDGACKNKYVRKGCIELSRKVLCMEEE